MEGGKNMNTLLILAFILFALMLAVGGKKGVKSFFSLFFNFLVVLISIVFMTDSSVDPIMVTAISSTIIAGINLFFINEVNGKTVTAFISTVITIGVLFSFIYIFTKISMIQGFGEEEIDEIIAVYSILNGVDFVKVAASVIIMSTLGAIIDVAI